MHFLAHLYYLSVSTSVSVVRTTFNSKYMGKGKLWPSANPKPLNRLSPNLNVVIRSWTPTTKKLGSIRPGVFAPHIGEIYTPSVRNLLHFFGSSTRLQSSPLDRFLRLIRQMTRFCARKCLLLLQDKNFIFDLFIRKTRKKYNGAYRENFQILYTVTTSVACKIKS